MDNKTSLKFFKKAGFKNPKIKKYKKHMATVVEKKGTIKGRSATAVDTECR